MKAKDKEDDKKGGMLLFVFLAALAPLACDAAESFSVQVPSNPILARVGSAVILPCWLSPPINAESMEVHWHRSSFKITVFHHKEGYPQDSSQDPRFRGRVFFGSRGPESGGLKGGDVSLSLENVMLEDEGEFQCYVSNNLHNETQRVVLNVIDTHTCDQSGQWKAAFIALLILALLAMAIAALLFLRNRRTGSKDSEEKPESVQLLQTDSDLSSSLPKIIDIDKAAKEKVDITLDEDTAHENLLLGRNRKSVRDSQREIHGKDPSKNRFTHHRFVLGKEGFTSGRAYWEVKLWRDIQGKELNMSWSLGVVRESAKRDCEVLTPSEGYLVFSSDRDNGLSVNTVPITRLAEKQRPQTLGVFLDYDKNMISFYNVEEKSHILTFFFTFREKVYPLFGPGKSDKVPLSIPEST